MIKWIGLFGKDFFKKCFSRDWKSGKVFWADNREREYHQNLDRK
jgi:hypothetical protein